MVYVDAVAHVLPKAAVAVEPVQCVVSDGMDDAFPEVVEDRDLPEQPADHGIQPTAYAASSNPYCTHGSIAW